MIFYRKHWCLLGIFSLLLFGVLIFYKFFIFQPFNLAYSENGFIKSIAQSLVDKLNKQYHSNFFSFYRNNVYVAHFGDDFIPKPQKTLFAKNILYLGSYKVFDDNSFNGYDYIFTSTQNLSKFLNQHHIKNTYLPLFIPDLTFNETLCARQPNLSECYWLLIQPKKDVQNFFIQQGLNFKIVDFADVKQIYSDIEHISGIFAQNTQYSDNTLDVSPIFLIFLAHKIPVVFPSSDSASSLAHQFNDNLFYYNSSSDFEIVLHNPGNIRDYKFDKISKFITQNHTSSAAAQSVLSTMKLATSSKEATYNNSLTINTSSPVGVYNGDYYLMQDLELELDKLGYSVSKTFELSTHFPKAQINIFQRGYLDSLFTTSAPINLLYLTYPIFTDETVISFSSYIQKIISQMQNNHIDAVVSSSKIVAQKLQNSGIKSYYIPQFTNTSKFYPDFKEDYKTDILFVGNNNGKYRQSALMLHKRGLPVVIYGSGYPSDIAKDTAVSNYTLRNHYSSAKIVLNDTRNEMKEYGYISNRIFDATACHTLVISDYMKEIEDIYGDCIPMYKNSDELIKLVEYYLKPENDVERLKKAQCAYDITLKNFTSDKAAKKFKQIIDDIKKQKNL